MTAKEKKPRAKKPKKVKNGHPAYHPCIDVYDKFIEKRLNCPIQFDGSDGVAMNRIIKWLESFIKKASDVEEVEPERICKAWEWFLNHYDKWDAYYKKNLRVRQIQSNLLNIFNSLVTGQKAKGKNELSAQEQNTVNELLK